MTTAFLTDQPFLTLEMALKLSLFPSCYLRKKDGRRWGGGRGRASLDTRIGVKSTRPRKNSHGTRGPKIRLDWKIRIFSDY